MDIALPLTEIGADPGSMRVEETTEKTIALIVDDFYNVCRADPVLGPIFNKHIRDWPSHLDHICSFWSSALLKTGRYAGRPIEIHAPLALTRDHYSRWLQLWNSSVRKHATPHDARVIVEAAAAMARAMIDRGYMSSVRGSGPKND